MSKRIAIYLPTLAGGGAEKMMLTLAEALALRGHAVDLVLNRSTGAYAAGVGDGVRVVELKRHTKWAGRYQALQALPSRWRALARPVLLARRPIMTLRYLPGLTAYLRAAQPDTLISALFYSNLIAIWAKRAAGVSTALVVTQRNTLSRQIALGLEKPGRRWRWRHLPALIGGAYPLADHIIAVSDGVAEDLAATTGVARASIKTIYNPVVSQRLRDRAAAPLAHPWFAAGAPPVILAAGRLARAKGFDVLIRAFAALAGGRDLRLLILGEGGERAALERLADDLGIRAAIEMPGFVANPYAHMARAGLFVLASRHEGLPAVLIEALACGCPVVATDCPSGPREILDGGRHGALVAVDDVDALAIAMAETLTAPLDRDALRARAEHFSVERALTRYLEIL